MTRSFFISAMVICIILSVTLGGNVHLILAMIISLIVGIILDYWI